jgi:hypothetical protein
MRKIVIIELAIIVLTLAIVLSLVFLAAQNVSVTKQNEIINANNADRYLSFDLQSGQTVRGSYIVDPINGNKQTFCVIIDPNGNEMISSPTNYEYDRNKATFSFTANINGRYYLSISIDDIWNHYIDYEYSISSPPILGVDRTVLTGVVITIGVVLALTIAVWDISRTRIKKIKQVNQINKPIFPMSIAARVSVNMGFFSLKFNLKNQKKT